MTTIRLRHLGCAAALLGATTIALAAPTQNLLKNGNFETPEVFLGGYISIAMGSYAGAWQAVGAGRNVSVVSRGFKVLPRLSFPAKRGKQWLDLTGASSNDLGGVEQTVATVPGARYELWFSVGNLKDDLYGYGTTSTVRVLVDGSALPDSPFRSEEGLPARMTWKPFCAEVTATSKRMTVTFLNEDSNGDNLNGLDDVWLVPANLTAPCTNYPQPQFPR